MYKNFKKNQRKKIKRSTYESYFSFICEASFNLKRSAGVCSSENFQHLLSSSKLFDLEKTCET